MTYKHFLHYRPFVLGIHLWPVDSLAKGQWWAVFFAVSLNKLLNKRASCQWFKSPWCSYISRHKWLTICVCFIILICIISLNINFLFVCLQYGFKRRSTTGSVDTSKVYGAGGRHAVGPDHEFKVFRADAHFEHFQTITVFAADRLQVRMPFFVLYNFCETK